ncbi:hypothetical protein [Streptomyces vietnamensis]|uniref:Uncharacterized protein n=1 Tax=Streptomyces vietnamensis TaxID=362257 RepID=A0A0B5HZR1_9ACTN|nr:hypothetical protein [Streptomyces vietnamensis]AJF67420.1 hypothetical protein SVTN_26635 [Streptomyces vietnamensis]
MFEYELQRMNHAELIAEAAAHRLAHEAAATHKGLRLFGLRIGGHATGAQVADGGRGRFAKAA